MRSLTETWISALIRRIFLSVGKVAKRQFQTQTAHMEAAQALTLRQILSHNQHTEFGRKYNFAQVLEQPDLGKSYTDQVPLHHYTDFAPDIERMQSGETNILIADPLSGLSYTSGTTNKPKLIPMTRQHQRYGLIYCGLIANAVTAEFLGNKSLGRGISLTSHAGVSQAEESGITMGTATEQGMKRMLPIMAHLWCSPAEVFSVSHGPSAHYLHALFGLLDSDAQYVLAIFGSYVLQWLLTLESRWEELLHDIEHGTLSENLELTSEQRRKLASTLTPNAGRAAELRAAAEPGFEGVMTRIWPQMTCINSVTTGSFAINAPALRKYAGKVPLYSSIYAASEGIMGMSLEANSDQYILTPQPAYFEFIPLAETDAQQPQTLPLASLAVGESYELVLSNHAGLYRYRIGDIIKLEGRHGSAPRFSFVRRKAVEISLVGEKNTEVHLDTALSQTTTAWLAERGWQIRDYTMAIDPREVPGNYVLYLELLPHPTTAADAKLRQEIAQILDEALGAANPRYASCREHLKIGPPAVKLLKPGSFDRFHEHLMNRNPGGNRNQVKIPRHLKDTLQVEFIENQVALP